MSLLSRLKAVQPIVIVLLLAIFLHAWAVSLLPQDFDEPVYLQNAFDYADAFRSGDLARVLDYTGNAEHPPFVKLLCSGAVLALGNAATWTRAFFASRIISAIFGVLAVLFVALAVDPLAAGLLAVHTLAVKYTSQVYLEAVPHAMTIGAVLAFLNTKGDKPNRWFWLSAIALGIAAASKYTYIPVILVVLGYLAIFEKKIKIQWLLLYGLLALVVFFALDIYLWHDPLKRLFGSLTYHLQYSQGQHVEEIGCPWYQPFIWIFTSPAGSWHPQVFFYYGFDGIISVFAVCGLKREWKERRWLVVWLVAGMLFLLLWSTKWPQYALTVTPALCIMGAETLRRLIRWVRAQESYWDYLKEMLPRPDKWLWYAIGAFAFFITAIYLSAAIKLAVGRVGWSHITQSNSFLPSNTIYDLLPLDNGKILIATDKGAALWIPAESTGVEPVWLLYTTGNSGLTNDQVLSLARDTSGGLWFGTADGVSRFDGKNWSAYQTEKLGLSSNYVISLASSPDGRVYAGTLSGAVVWDGIAWTPIVQAENQPVFALLISDHTLWFSIPQGVWQINVPEGAVNFYPTESPVKHLLIDSSGTLWAATLGAGLARWEDGTWQYLSIANSGIPFNTVNWVAEVQPGFLWVGTAMSTSAGGASAQFDGTNWYSYLTDNSGASGAEVTVIAVQSGQVWMGTRTEGIDCYQLGRTK
jgi:4-amino-4-deoxy-L-arabinose transferase-like glycosyltransferase